MEEKKECLRQVVHLLYGPFLLVLHHKGFLTNEVMLYISIAFALWILFFRFEKNLITKLLKKFERKDDLENFPLKWVFFFTIWAFLSFYLFEDPAAYAAILILWLWDSISNVFGRNYWKHWWVFNKKKTIEWSLAGFLAAAAASGLIVGFLPALLASLVAMILEAVDLKIWKIKIDDNFTIPLVTGLILSYV